MIRNELSHISATARFICAENSSNSYLQKFLTPVILITQEARKARFSQFLLQLNLPGNYTLNRKRTTSPSFIT